MAREPETSSSPTSDRTKLVLAGLITCGFVVRLCILSRPIDVLTHRYLADDFFYYLEVAFHVAHGSGSTFDGGISHTNGYNPLLMWLLAAVFWSGASKIVAVRAGLLIEAVSMVVLAWLAAAHCQRRSGPGAALLVAGALSFATFFIWPTVNGFETPLAAAIALLALDLHDRRVPGPWVGVVAGLAFLARSDSVVVLAVLLVDHVRRRELRAAVQLSATFSAASLPFCLWSVVRFGLLLPGSAVAKTRLREIASIRSALGVAFTTLPKVLFPAPITGHLPPIATSGLAAVMAVFLLLGLRRLGFVRAMLLGSLTATYILVADGFEAGALRRYLFLPWVFSLAACAMGLERITRWRSPDVPPRARLAWPAVASMGFLLIAHFVEAIRLVRWDRATPPLASYVGTCRELAARLPEWTSDRDRVGSFDSGSLGYFSAVPVVNLDGLVNDDTRRLWSECPPESRATCWLDYMRAKGISVLVGDASFSWTRLFPDWTSWPKLHESRALSDGSEVVVLRVPQAAQP